MPNTQTDNFPPTVLAGGAAIGTPLMPDGTSLIVAANTGANITDSAPFFILVSNLDTSDEFGPVEIMKVTAATGDTYTVTRAQQNTQARAWPIGITRVAYWDLESDMPNLYAEVTDILAARPVGQSATAVATASNGTIATAGLAVSRVNPAGAVTGVILQAGTTAAQFVTVVNESANSVTMDVAGTSHVADGVSTVIAAKTASTFAWDSATSLWYHVK